MALSVLEAEPVVVIAAGQSSADAEVKWNSPHDDLAIRERVNGGSWNQKTGLVNPNEQDPKTGLPSPDTLRKGEYSVRLRPGDKYEAEAFSLNEVTSGAATPRRLGYVMIIGLKNPVTFEQAEPFQPEVGGTYWFARVAAARIVVTQQGPTKQPLPTWVRLQIGSVSSPVLNGPGVIPNPIIDMVSDVNTVHDLEAVPLLPGSDLRFVVTIADIGSPGSTGEWEQKIGPFRTLLRGASINLKQLVITDTAEAGWAGPARFAFQIRDGAGTVFKDCQFRIEAITDDAPYDKIDLETNFPCSHVIAPAPVPPLPAGAIGVALRGVEEDTIGPDDVAVSGFTALVFPNGRFKESFSKRIQTVRATERAADPWKFEVKVEYSANYVPG